MSVSEIRDSAAPTGPFALMAKFYRYVLPEVRSQLIKWRERASQIPDAELQKQAIASMTAKQFHCEGGSVYAAVNLAERHVLVPLIVAFQTISDYLDNLCDRSTSLDAGDFRCLHQAMLDAVDPSAPLHDYYAFHPEKDDGGYLDSLVKTCQSCICLLPSYGLAKQRVVELVVLYCDLQVYKHIGKDSREQALSAWWETHRQNYPALRWNEFAAATGSTLGVFMLFAASADKFMQQETPDLVFAAYFPYVCGLHILLDYLIDQDEDTVGGDLNFCKYYENSGETAARISWVAVQARQSVQKLEHNRFHGMVIEGLLALYLSDPKVRGQANVKRVSRKLMRKSPLIRIFFWFNSIWIRRRRN